MTVVRLALMLLFILPFYSQAQGTANLEIVAGVQLLYGRLAAYHNQELEFNLGTFTNSELASADSDGKVHTVTVSKELLLNPRLTSDALRMIICHELGHIFGGAPRRSVPYEWNGPTASDGLSFLSSEGQADYYASAACFRTIIAGEDHKKVLKESKVDSVTISRCDQVWGSGSEGSAICQRSITAAENFLNLYHDFHIHVGDAEVAETDKLIRDQYPSKQCRLDTFVHGALCKSRKNLKFDFDNSNKNDCENLEGKRPACWFR